MFYSSPSIAWLQYQFILYKQVEKDKQRKKRKVFKSKIIFSIIVNIFGIFFFILHYVK